VQHSLIGQKLDATGVWRIADSGEISTSPHTPLSLDKDAPDFRGKQVLYDIGPSAAVITDRVRSFLPEAAKGRYRRDWADLLGVPRRTLYGKLERYDARHKSNGRSNGNGHRASRDDRNGLK